MKSFATRSQRDRTFDRLVQSSNHSTIIQRKVPICKSSPNKSPPVIQRPVPPRKCVIITSFSGEDEVEEVDEFNTTRPIAPIRLHDSNSTDDPRDTRRSKSVSFRKVVRDGDSVPVPNSEENVSNNSKIQPRTDEEKPAPLRVTFRLKKCSSNSTKPSSTGTTACSSAKANTKSTYVVLNKSVSSPLTLSFKRQQNVPTDDDFKWEISAPLASDDELTSRLSSPPLIQNSIGNRESLSPSQGVKRKPNSNVNDCEQLDAFVSTLEGREKPKRRMLQPPSSGIIQSSEASSSGLSSFSDAHISSTSSKSRSLMTQKILMSKSISAPSESSLIKETDSTSLKKKQSLLKKGSSLSLNRKAVYNPRQWIGGDIDDDVHTHSSASESHNKRKKEVKAKSSFDFDSDDGDSSKSSESPPPPPRLPARPLIPSSSTSDASSFATSSKSRITAPTPLPSDKVESSVVHQPVLRNNVHSEKTNHLTTIRPRPGTSSDQDPRALYTVVRKVKEAHECQESGETQDLLDDVEYMLDGLKNSESPATRCLSLLRLCKECLAQSFRMTLKAHGLLPRIFSHVVDAPDDGDCGVALHTAALLFILSRDKLAAGDLDKEGLRILLRLIHCDGKGLNVIQSRELDRIRSRLRPVIEQVTKSNATKASSNSVAQRLHLTCFTAKDLAAESLLNLSVRKASDWFKNELRKEGGLDHFCRATIDAMDYFNNELESQDLTEFMLDRLRRIEQYMRLLENMTYMNGSNQEYLVQFEKRSFLDSIADCLRLCVNNLPKDSQPDSPSIKVIVACLLSIWRVLLNISHDNEKCSDRLGAHPLLIPIALHCILRLPRRLPVHRRFDILVLTLGFLVNIVEHCDDNRGRLAFIQVRLPWRRPRWKLKKRRGLVLKPTTANDESSSSDEYDGTESSSDEDEDSRPKTALDALVKLFLERYEESERHELQQEDDGKAENGKDHAESSDVKDSNEEKQEGKEGDDDGMKWRLIEDKQLERQRRGRHRPFRLLGRKEDNSEGEEEAGDSDSDSGADIEFMPSTQEQTDALESALSRAGEHMEASMTASYVALLLGCMMRGSRRRVDRVQGRLPDGKFKPLALSLAKFLGFMSLTSAVGQAGGKSMLEVVNFLHELDGEFVDDDDHQMKLVKP